MFARIKKLKNKNGYREYLIIVENKRENGKTKQKTIVNLGRIDILEKDGVADLVMKSIDKYQQNNEMINLAKEGKSDWSKEYGSILVLRKAWKDLGFDNMFRKYAKDKKNQDKIAESVFCLVCNRLLSPSSELGIIKWINKVYEPEWDKFNTQDFYRGLDFLINNKKNMEIDIFQKTTNLFNQELDILMFDTTTIKYWGKGNGAKELLKHGYSKEKRGDLKQLIVGVLMTKEGMPVGHEVWPGNTSDLKSFIEIVEDIKTRYSIGRIVWVGDKGMVSEFNIDKLNEMKQDYIFGVRMRQLGKEKREEILTLEGMEPVKIHKKNESYDLYVKEVKVEDKRYIVCFNPDEFEKQREKRAYFANIMKSMVENRTQKEWIMKNGYRKYIDLEEGEIKFNSKRLMEESWYDGKWVLLTNTDLPAREVVSYYKGLWQIEAGFRDLKHELEANPVYHQKERRIRAHIFVCFLAQVLKQTLAKKLREENNELRYSKVMEDVEKIKAVKISTNRQEFIFRTEFIDKAHLAFKVLGLSPPSRIIQAKQQKRGATPH